MPRLTVSSDSSARHIDLRQQIGLTSQEKETIVDTKDHPIRWANKCLKRVFQEGGCIP